MKTITVKNSEGDTIEVSKTPEGKVEILHSDVGGGKEAGEFVELTAFLELANRTGVPLDLALIKRGGFDAAMLHRGQVMKLDAEEIEKIRAAIS